MQPQTKNRNSQNIDKKEQVNRNQGDNDCVDNNKSDNG